MVSLGHNLVLNFHHIIDVNFKLRSIIVEGLNLYTGGTWRGQGWLLGPRS